MTERHHSFSILTAVRGPSVDALLSCASSVFAQRYPRWKWYLVDEAAEPNRQVARALEQLALRDSRIRIVQRQALGGGSAINDALADADGDFVVLLTQGDSLAIDALGVANHHLCQHTDVDYLYSDEATIRSGQEAHEVFTKPCWSPERLLCQNYCGDLSVVRRSLLESLGGVRPEFGTAEHYDMVLRVTEKAQLVVHVPEVLYIRELAGETPAEGAHAADQKRAVEAALARRGIRGSVLDVGPAGHRVVRELTARPRVSIIVPTKGTVGSIWGMDLAFITNMIDSVRSCSTYDHIEFVVVHDTDTPAKVINSLRPMLRTGDQMVPFDEPFNFSRKCNLGAIKSTGEVLIFMNDDVEVKTPDWVERMISFLEDETVGMTGPLLLLDNFCIQSAGHTSAPPTHFAAGKPPMVGGGPGSPLSLNREVSGVTGACMAMRRDTFEGLGGFANELPVNYNDVDLCFKVLEAGMRIVWTPDAELFHFESKSRPTRVRAEEISIMKRYWARHLRRDQYLPFTGGIVEDELTGRVSEADPRW